MCDQASLIFTVYLNVSYERSYEKCMIVVYIVMCIFLLQQYSISARGMKEWYNQDLDRCQSHLFPLIWGLEAKLNNI